MKKRHTPALQSISTELSEKALANYPSLGSEAAALPDLIKTELEANSFRSEQEGCSHCCCPSCSNLRGLWKTQAWGDVP